MMGDSKFVKRADLTNTWNEKQRRIVIFVCLLCVIYFNFNIQTNTFRLSFFFFFYAQKGKVKTKKNKLKVNVCKSFMYTIYTLTFWVSSFEWRWRVASERITFVLQKPTFLRLVFKNLGILPRGEVSEVRTVFLCEQKAKRVIFRLVKLNVHFLVKTHRQVLRLTDGVGCLFTYSADMKQDLDFLRQFIISLKETNK